MLLVVVVRLCLPLATSTPLPQHRAISPITTGLRCLLPSSC